MNSLLVAAGIWAAFAATCTAALLWSTRVETLADLGPTGHAGIADLDADDCEWCHRADDLGALAWFDVEAWESEMREAAS